MDSKDTGVIRVREWKWRLLLVAAVAVALGVLLGLGLLYLMSRSDGAGFTFGLLAGAPVLAILVMGYGGYLIRSDGIREVVLSASKLEFVLGKETIEVNWAELSPPKHPLFFGDISFYFPKELGPAGTVGTDKGRVAVTKRQAIAMVSHPSCPRWNLSDDVKRSLGV
jgi:hypothetical protein